MNDKLDHFVLEYDHESGTALLAMTAAASPRAGPFRTPWPAATMRMHAPGSLSSPSMT